MARSGCDAWAVARPWPDPTDSRVFQSGAWVLPDERPLSLDLEAFIESGDPPVYFGFGSTRAPEGMGRAMLDAARMLGRRMIVSQGWFDDPLLENERDCLSIADVEFHLISGGHRMPSNSQLAPAQHGQSIVVNL